MRYFAKLFYILPNHKPLHIYKDGSYEMGTFVYVEINAEDIKLYDEVYTQYTLPDDNLPVVTTGYLDNVERSINNWTLKIN